MEFISLQHQLCCREEQNKEERGALCLNLKLGNGNKMPLIARVKTLFFNDGNNVISLFRILHA